MKNRTKKRAFAKLLLWMLIGGAVGFAAGILGVMGAEVFQERLMSLSFWIGTNLPVILGCFLVLSVALSIICYRKGEAWIKRCQACVDDEGEDEADRRYELWGNIGITGTSILILLSIAAFAFRTDVTGQETVKGLMISVVLLLLITIVCVWYQVICVRQIQRKDPMKKGDALDPHFDKEWERSLDEAEKRIAYEAGYNVFLKMKIFLMGMIVVALLGQMFFGTGLMAVVLLTICNIVILVMYTYYSWKLGQTTLED